MRLDSNTKRLTGTQLTGTLSETNDPNDLDLARRVTIYLATRHRPGLRPLGVQARTGVVTLRGSVSTFYEKQLAVLLAARVAGVVRIVDDVVVNQRPITFPIALSPSPLRAAV